MQKETNCAHLGQAGRIWHVHRLRAAAEDDDPRGCLLDLILQHNRCRLQRQIFECQEACQSAVPASQPCGGKSQPNFLWWVP